MIINGYVGPTATKTSLGSGTNPALRLGNMGDAVVSELEPRYYEATYRGMAFSGANQALVGTAIATGLTATYTGGLVLSNTFGNPVNVVLTKVAYGAALVQTNASVIGLMVGQSSTALAGTVTSVTPTSDLVGSGIAPYAVLASSASITLPTTPVLKRVLGFLGTGAVTVDQTTLTVVDLEGSIILPPGGYCAFYSSAAGTASSLIFSMSWIEVPL